MTALTAEIARDLLEYDPGTGKLFWRSRAARWFKANRYSAEENAKRWNKRYANKEAFTATLKGHLTGAIFKRNYLAHRVIWLIQTGNWPPDQIDHIDGVPGNNRWDNLRAVSNQENSSNQAISTRNTSGTMGVRWVKKDAKWEAGISPHGRYIYLGQFDRKEDAVEARKKAERKHGFHENHGRPCSKQI